MSGRFEIATRDHLNNRQPKGFGKFIVPVVVARHRHNGSGTVAHQYIV